MKFNPKTFRNKKHALVIIMNAIKKIIRKNNIGYNETINLILRGELL